MPSVKRILGELTLLELCKKLLGEEHSNTKTINQNYEWLKQQMK